MAKFIGAIARTFKIKKLIVLKQYLKFTTYFETCGCSKHYRPNFEPISWECVNFCSKLLLDTLLKRHEDDYMK